MFCIYMFVYFWYIYIRAMGCQAAYFTPGRVGLGGPGSRFVCLLFVVCLSVPAWVVGDSLWRPPPALPLAAHPATHPATRPANPLTPRSYRHLAGVRYKFGIYTCHFGSSPHLRLAAGGWAWALLFWLK